MDVYTVELIRREGYWPTSGGLAGDIANHLFSYEVG